jgi:sugar/nucleoside kinase (ribokinase family)
MSPSNKHLLIIGGASFDVLHLEDRTVDCVGGVGMYTAMAAKRSGVDVSMLSPRPDPLPESLQPVADRLNEWLGPVAHPEQLPHIEISYRGGVTEYLNVSLGVATTAYSTKILPPDISKYDVVHVAQKSEVSTQLTLIQACRKRGIKKISAGTYPVNAMEDPEGVRAVIEQSDYFFMNDFEAQSVFGSLESAHTKPGNVLFITMGPKGACVIQGTTPTMVPAVSTTELDPTGAGDTFCGATLAFLMQNLHPIMATRQAVALAAEMITYIGPTALLFDDPPPGVPTDQRVVDDNLRVRKVGRKLSRLSEVAPFTFVGREYPPVGHPKTIDFFFAATLQQFSFWSTVNDRYHQPLIATIDGEQLKGSDYLWAAYKRQLERDPDFYTPARQANLTREELLDVFRSDDGKDPMPALDLHLEMANHYGQDMLALQITPQSLLEEAIASPEPLATFIARLDKIGGYKEDPLRKKSSLLVLILNQRPENYFPLRDDEKVTPVIDYHLMRSFLRVGLINVVDSNLEEKLVGRQIVSFDEEWAVRYVSYRAMEQLVEESGKSEGAVDYFFFNARKNCPEMSEPQCQYCKMDPVCAHRKDFFQPVLRTSYY